MQTPPERLRSARADLEPHDQRRN